jgi:regulator-associated protein of mTOR
MLKDPVPEVRTASIYALGTLIGDDILFNEAVGLGVLGSFKDASPIARKELVGTLGKLIDACRARIVAEAVELIEERYGIIMAKRQGVPPPEIVMPRNIYTSIWTVMLTLSVDSSTSVAEDAISIVDAVNIQALDAASTDILSSYYIRKPNEESKDHVLTKQNSSISLNMAAMSVSRSPARNSNSLMPPSSSSQSTPKGLKKSASFASSLRSLAGFGPATNTPRSRNSMGGYGPSVQAISPLNEATIEVKRRASDVPLDVAAGGGTFFDSCCEYFTESQMRV